MRMLNPEWEERELQEMQDAERREAEAANRHERRDESEQRHIDDAGRRSLQTSGEAMAAAIHAADVERNGPLEPLGMTVPAWWDTWQSFASESGDFREDRHPGSPEQDVHQWAQEAYERGWRDCLKRVEATILASLHGLD